MPSVCAAAVVLVTRCGWALAAGATLGSCLPASFGAAAILSPSRRHVSQRPPIPFTEASWDVGGLRLRGWRFAGRAPRRGLLIYLHGVADNRAGSAGLAQRYGPRGWDVLGYDGRAHGDSEGEFCTYGFYEKRDLARVLDSEAARPVVLLGHSLGAAVALQVAAEDRRLAGVVAVSSFAELRTVIGERAPFFASRGNVRDAIALAEKRAAFRVDEVAPAEAARRIQVPVLLLHGAEDSDTLPAHAQRIFANLAGPRQLLLVGGAHHNDVLAHPEAWAKIDRWLDELLGTPGR
jgi:pimeloyl-ACP methyl ester carboxylesterase